MSATPTNGPATSMVTVAHIDELPVGAMKAVEVDGKDYVIFNLAGELHALRDQCPHQGARLSCGLVTGAVLPCDPGERFTFALEGEVIACPWHRWKFSIRTGQSLFGTDRRRVPKVPVHRVGDEIMIAPPHRPARRATAS